MISGHIHGSDERGKIIRRTLARYLLILQALTFQAISTSVKKRFPTEDHLVEAGIMTKEEKIAYDEVPSTHGKWWVPAAWFTTLVIRARKEGRIKDDILLRQILDELYVYRTNCGTLFAYDWVSIPLVYTQTVSIATYTYFVANVMGRQYLDINKGYSGHEIDLYVPIFTILEFFFFMGWLKVAEQLINPFGEDDDDFELNWILDRNLVVSMYNVDQMHNNCPKLTKDSFYDEIEPTLPYTRSSFGLRSNPHLGSAMNLDITGEDTSFLATLDPIMEDELDKLDFDPLSLSQANTPIYEPYKIDYPTDKMESVSQIGSNLIPSLSGSRFMSSITGRSSDDVGNVKNPDKLQHEGHAAPFILKNPRKKDRKVSLPAQLKQSASSNQISQEGNETLSLGQSYSPKGKVKKLKEYLLDERRSLVIDFDREANKHLSPLQLNKVQKSRPMSVSVDEKSFGLNFNQTNQETENKVTSKFINYNIMFS